MSRRRRKEENKHVIKVGRERVMYMTKRMKIF